MNVAPPSYFLPVQEKFLEEEELPRRTFWKKFFLEDHDLSITEQGLLILPENLQKVYPYKSNKGNNVESPLYIDL